VEVDAVLDSGLAWGQWPHRQVKLEALGYKVTLKTAA
jgi:hypothetical protein